MPILPFSWNPKHWGLDGAERDTAEAHYTLKGEALDRRLLEIKYSGRLTKEHQKQFKLDRLELDFQYGVIDEEEYHDARIGLMFKKDSDDFKQAKLEVQLENNEISDYEFDLGVTKIKYKDHESEEYLVAVADLDLAYGNINQQQHERTVADAKREPWVKVIHADLIEEDGGETRLSFELDWNTFFVEELMRKGWTGLTAEEIVDQWFTQTCQSSMNSEEYLLQEGDQE
jgi:hypothetical protein